MSGVINIINSTNILKVLTFLSRNSGKEYINSEIQKATKISRMGIFVALRELNKYHLIKKYQKGKLSICSVDLYNPIIKQFKVLDTIITLEKTINQLKNVSIKIILFGSSSRGEDDAQSDVDLFILTRVPEVVQSIIFSLKKRKKIQAIIKTPTDFVEFQEKESLFKNEIERGIILWEVH